MDIQYDSEGRILSCEPEGAREPGGRVLRVPDKQLQADFLSTFALGKYIVRAGKVVKAEKFTSPKIAPTRGLLEGLLGLSWEAEERKAEPES